MTFDLSKIKIYADGADIKQIKELLDNPLISGFTTNPTLMRAAGVNNYEHFAKKLLDIVEEKPVSLEVFSDDFQEMYEQALTISSWGSNVYIKIPVTNTKGDSSSELIKKLVSNGIKVNATAVMTRAQILEICKVLNNNIPSNISIFAGRIADTGREPAEFFTYAKENLKNNSNCKLIWASPREILNVIQAISIGCEIITITPNLLSKIDLLGYSLEDYSRDTVEMFYKDALLSGYII